MKIIGFDIETIPQKQKLTKAQEEWLASRLKYANEKAPPNERPEETKKRVMATNPYLGEIVCISVGESLNGKINTMSFTGKEPELLKNFWSLLGKIGSAQYVSFNGLKFDTNFITLRSMHHNIPATNKQFLNTSKFRKNPHFDVMQWMSDWGYPIPSLDLACDIAGVQSSKEGAIKAKDVAQAYEDGRIKEIAEYCEEDVRATMEVFFKLKNYIRD